jgi:HlyD family secretion protein
MKKIATYLIVMLLTCSLFGTFYYLHKKSASTGVAYAFEKPERANIVKKTVATGTIVPRKEVSIKANVSGVVDKIYVKEGQTVKKGDLLAHIELIPDMERLRNAESRLERARIKLRSSQYELEQHTELFKKLMVSKADFNRYELNHRLQAEEVAAAIDEVDLIRDGVSKVSKQAINQVRSTIDGTVLVLAVKEGAFVTQTNLYNEGTTIAKVANMGDLVFEGKLDESEVERLHKGMELLLNIAAIDGKAYTARLEHIAPSGVADQGAVKFDIRAAVNLGPADFIRAGYSANADIILDQRKDALTIREANIVFDKRVAYVEVQTGEQQFARRKVQLGLSDGMQIEVLSGLTANDAIRKQ